VTDDRYAEHIRRALEARPDIRPDEATKAAIGWEGEAWRPVGKDGLPDETEAQDEGLNQEPGRDQDARFSLLTDAPSEDEDRLGRGPYALFLARRLNHIWHKLNAAKPSSPMTHPKRNGARESDTFILHVDAPWGGGKTTFANFVARVLQPTDETITRHHFLYSSLGGEETRSLAKLLSAPAAADPAHPEAGAQLPWIIARYNAWRDQYVQPPWWQIFCAIQSAVDQALVREKAWGRRFDIWWTVQRYKLGNSKLRGQLTIWAMLAALLLLLAATGVLNALWSTTDGSADAIARLVGAIVAMLGFGGVGVATLFTLIGQSLDPDLDFTAESKQVGVVDPISRFRAMFERTLELAGSPVLLIVDDIDRCDPKMVVEVMRGFQTVVRSSRLFVMLLGDRAWIEAAHDLHHKDMGAIADPESSLGAQFVRKVIQLSFRLPLMSEAARQDYTRYILSSSDMPRQAEQEVTDILQALERELDTSALAATSVAQREIRIEEAANNAKQQLEKQGQPGNDELVDRIIAIKQVVAASEDSDREAKLSAALAELFAGLPNNPRQMKRIVMAFGIYENVGRIYYQYRQTATGDDGEIKSKRWRQLAIWVTLATEWPATWRELARWPGLLRGSGGDTVRRDELDRSLELLPDSERDRLKPILRRIRTDPSLKALISDIGSDSALDEDAIHEFNRIIWEPGFKLQPDAE
jgi:hypothetical protein